MTLCDWVVFLASWTKCLDETVLERLIETVSIVADEVSTNGEISVCPKVNELAEFFRVGLVAGRRERHYGPFFEKPETQMLGYSGVQHAERFEDLSLRDALKAISVADID